MQAQNQTSLCHVMDLCQQKTTSSEMAQLFERDLTPDSLTNHFVMQKDMTKHLVPCCLTVLKAANFALQDSSDSITYFPFILTTLDHVHKKLAGNFTKEQEEDLALETIECLRGILVNFVKNPHKRLLIEEDASILHKLEELLLSLISHQTLQKRMSLEIVRIWTELAGLNAGQRAGQMIDGIWEYMGGLVKESKKREYEFEVEPTIQLMQGITWAGKRVQLGNFLILRTIQRSIVAKCTSTVTKLLKKNQVETAKQELNETAKIISAVLGKMLQRTLDEMATGKGEKAFMCQSFVDDVLQGLYDLSLPISSWIVRVLSITLIKLLETERKHSQFRIFLTTLLVKCYQHLLTFSNQPTIHCNKPFESCTCKGLIGEFNGHILKCSTCGNYFHNTCVGVSRKEAEIEGYTYYCKECLIKHKTISETVQQITGSKDKVVKKRYEANNETEPEKVITKDLLVAFYDSRIAEKSEDMKEAKMFSILKWIMHCDNTEQKIVDLYKQYLLSERAVETEIIKEIYAGKYYQQLVNMEEVSHIKPRMKTTIISLLADSSYHIRIKSLKCLKNILLKEFSLATITDHWENVRDSLIALSKDEHAKIRAIAIEIIHDLIHQHYELAGTEQSLWKALEGRMLDTSSLVRKEAIDNIIGLLIKGKGDQEIRNRVVTLLFLLGLDDKRKAMAERVVQGLYELWSMSGKVDRRTQGLNEYGKKLMEDLLGVITRKEISFNLLCKVVLKVYQINRDAMFLIFGSVIANSLQRLKEAKNCSAIIEFLTICSHVAPELVEPHLLYLSCFLSLETATEYELAVTKSICLIISNTAHCYRSENYDTYKKAQVQLMQLTCVAPLGCLEYVVQALASIIQKVTFEEIVVASILEKAIVLLQVQANNLEKEKLPSVYRSLSLIGYLCYFFDFEKLKTLQFQSDSNEPFSQQLFDLFKDLYINLKKYEAAQDRVLESISYLWMRYNYLLPKSEDMLIDALNRNKKPESIKRTLQMVYKLFQGGNKAVPGDERSESQMALLVPKLFGKLEQFSRHKSEDVRYWAFSTIKTLADKGFANHTQLIDIFYVLLVDTSVQVVEGAFGAIENFAEKKNVLLSMNLRQRISQSFAFAYKIYAADLSPLQSLNCVYAKYFALLHHKSRYAYIDCLIEILFDTSEEVLSPLMYQYLLWILFALEYTESEKRYVLTKLENFKDANQTLAIENLKKGKKGNRVLFLALVVSRIEIALDTIKHDPRKPDGIGNKENESVSKAKDRGKTRFKLGKTKLAKHLEEIEELEKVIETKVTKQTYATLKRVCKEIRRQRESLRKSMEIEEEDDTTVKSSKKARATFTDDEGNIERKRKKTIK